MDYMLDPPEDFESYNGEYDGNDSYDVDEAAANASSDWENSRDYY